MIRTKALHILILSITGAAMMSIMGVALTGCGPKQPTVAERRAEKHVRDSLDLMAQEKSIAYYDSLLQAVSPTIDPLLKRFLYEKNEQYEDHGHYVHRLLKTDSNTRRNFLQAYVQDDSKMLITSYYFGETSLCQSRITLTADSLTTSFTGDTHYFEAEGFHETLTLSNDDAVQLLKFVDMNHDKRIKVTLEGKSKYKYFLSENDKTALMETYQLGVIMQDIHQLEVQIKQTSLQISKYQRRLGKYNTKNTQN
ncbi:MAG: hypothetical protein MJZ92_06325 [Paludibacteraceae bacterium]|nr:hypothetical protein [Paludibacteraceae bacterium]